MEIIIATISIFVITGVMWLLNRLLPFEICPICAGVSGTWLWILVGIYFGLLEAGSWLLVAAIAMGGSVVGIAYQVEKRLPQGRSPLAWKLLFIPVGFMTVYFVARFYWLAAVIGILWLIAVTLLFWRVPGAGKRINGEEKVKELEEKMKKCC